MNRRSTPWWPGALLLSWLALAGTGIAPATAQDTVPPAPVDSVVTETVVVVPGARYDAGSLRRLLDGVNHRSLWTRPLEVPVLDLDRFGGGLVPDHESGNQSRTLHLTAPDGRTYIFRSVDKYLDRVLPEDLRYTWFHDLAQDHVSMFMPTGGLVVPALHENLDLLAVPAVLRVMPDDPRLGEFRERFAGMLGLVVERPNEGEEGEPLYGGFPRIIATDRLLERLEEHPRNRVDAREYLASRLIDFLVGDTDRGPDQWRWAQVDEPQGLRWRPIARDRDWAFHRADGLLAAAARIAFPKLVAFDRRIPSMEALTFADLGLGRTLLTELDRDAWEEVVREVQAGLTDEAINAAVTLLPPEHRRSHAGELASALKARRGQLPQVADAFYRRLASEVDVRATDANDRAEIVRQPDGLLRVTLFAPAGALTAEEDEEGPEGQDGQDGHDGQNGQDGVEGIVDGWAPYFERTFRPDETREVRVFLHGGSDTAVVRGTGAEAITVRVIGGGGEDVLQDAGTPAGRTVLYDDDEGTDFVAGRDTRVDTRAWDPPERPATFFVQQLTRERDWGRERSWFNPALDYLEGAGVVVGGGPTWTRYGFRHLPYASKLSLKALFGTASGGVGLDGVGESRFENSPLGLRLHVRASQLEGVRFYGLGNASPELASSAAWIQQDRVLVEPSLILRSARWWGEVGPVFRWVDPDVPADNPLSFADPGLPGDGSVSELGARAVARFRAVDHDNVPTRGVHAEAGVAGYPLAGDDARRVNADVELRGYVPLPIATGPVLALRAGGRRVWGDAPLHDLAWIGGRTTLRGYQWERFAGDAAVYGGAELRVPLFRANLGLARGRLGVLGLGDAGRVYLDGASPGGWHTGYGAGLYFETLHTAVHMAWARGDGDRLYAGLGMPF